jgi:hypothetical protein
MWDATENFTLQKARHCTSPQQHPDEPIGIMQVRKLSKQRHRHADSSSTLHPCVMQATAKAIRALARHMLWLATDLR